MTFDETMRGVAHEARHASSDAMKKLGTGTVKHEDDLTGDLVGMLEHRINHLRIGNVRWDSAILTHRRSGEEGEYGADMLIHVSLNTPRFKYSKGVLVQAKRIGPKQRLTVAGRDELVEQCEKMLKYTPDAFVMAFDPRGLRAASATKIAGSSERTLYDQCDWTAYRFFLELFRCPIGDPRITSAKVDELEPLHGISIGGRGTLDPDPQRHLQD
jgi:hypothetical protein